MKRMRMMRMKIMKVMKMCENELEDEGDDMSMLRIRMMDIMRMEITGKKMMKTMIVRIMRWG